MIVFINKAVRCCILTLVRTNTVLVRTNTFLYSPSQTVMAGWASMWSHHPQTQQKIVRDPKHRRKLPVVSNAASQRQSLMVP